MFKITLNPTILFFSFIVFFLISSASQAQCLAGDCENGFGKFKTEYRILYSFFENGVPSTFAIEKYLEFTICYQIIDGNKNGIEVKYNSKGLFVINQYQNGLKNGYMISGNYKRLTGKAFLYENDKKVESLYSAYEKQVTSSKGNALCKGDCKNGLGLRRLDDTYYFGVFNSRKASPIGVDQWDNSPEIYLGGSDNFSREPFGMYRYESGVVYIGEYSKGEYNGKGVWISKDGILYASIYKRGKEIKELYREQLTDTQF